MIEKDVLLNVIKFYKDIGVEYMNVKPLKALSAQANNGVYDIEKEFHLLEEEVKNCTTCELHKTKTHYVFGDGNIKTELMVVGEAPGAQEDLLGKPFVGRAGMLLNDLLSELGLDRSKVYIANCLKCRPPNNRDPAEVELKACTPFLHKQIKLINPKVIVTLGRFAMGEFIGKDKQISRVRGMIFKKGEYCIIPTYHPAYLLRNPKVIEIFVHDLKTAIEQLNSNV